MIDFEATERYLKARTERSYFIPVPAKCQPISWEEFMFLSRIFEKYPASEVNKIFEPVSDGTVVKYSVEIMCERCSDIYLNSLSKTALLSLLRDMKCAEKRNQYRNRSELTCPECLHIEKKKEQDEWDMELERRISFFISNL